MKEELKEFVKNLPKEMIIEFKRDREKKRKVIERNTKQNFIYKQNTKNLKKGFLNFCFANKILCIVYSLRNLERTQTN